MVGSVNGMEVREVFSLVYSDGCSGNIVAVVNSVIRWGDVEGSGWVESKFLVFIAYRGFIIR